RVPFAIFHSSFTYPRGATLMRTLASHFYETEGPYGLRMSDAQANALEARLKKLPKDEVFTLHRLPLTKGIDAVLPEERADVSWISAETTDRSGDIIRAAGMDDS